MRDLSPAPLHEVVQVPVPDAGDCQFAEFLQFKPQRLGGESRSLRVADQLRQRRAL